MTYVLEFEIPHLPQMTNHQSGASTHWRNVHKERNLWHSYVWFAVRGRVPLAPLERIRLVLVRHSSSEPDYDGLVRGFKYVVDGLQSAGVISNDKLSNTGAWDCRWQKTKAGKGKITVKVEEVPNE